MRSTIKKSEVYPTLKELLKSQTKISVANVPLLTGHCEMKESDDGTQFRKISSHSSIGDPVDADAFTVSVTHFHQCVSYKELLLDLLQRDKDVIKVLFRQRLFKICYVGGDFDFIPDLFVELQDSSLVLIDVVSVRQAESSSFRMHQALIWRYCESKGIGYLCLVNRHVRQCKTLIDL